MREKEWRLAKAAGSSEAMTQGAMVKDIATQLVHQLTFYHRQQEELTWDSQGGTRCLGCMYCTTPNGWAYNPLTNGR